MVAMWLPSPSALLSAHDMRRSPSVLHPPHHQPYVLTSNLSADLVHRHTLYSPPSHHHTSTSAAHVKNLVSRPTTVVKVSSPRSPIKKVFCCPYPDCSQTSSNKGNLSKHIATRHEHRKDFACPFKGCTRRFAKKYNMLRHLSASGVHRTTKSPSKVIGKGVASERAKWTSIELDLANFLAKQCQQTVSAM